MIRRVIPAIALLCALLVVLVTPSLAIAADQSYPQQHQAQQQIQGSPQKQYSQSAPMQTSQQSQSPPKNQSLQASVANFFTKVANQFSGKQKP